MKERALTVGIEDDEIVIRIGIDVLAVASEAWPNHSIKVTDKCEWAKSIVSQLEDEDEDGTTLVHKMFESAMSEAIEWGEEGAEVIEDDQ